MASVVYTLLLFIFIFGAGLTFMTESQIFCLPGTTCVGLGGTGVASNVTQAQQKNTEMLTASQDSGLNYVKMLQVMGSSIVGGVTALVTLGPLMMDLGVPPNLAVFFISPLGFVIVFWLIEMFLGRPAE
jgi:hypothetical protein